jgi:hypothetical protein
LQYYVRLQTVCNQDQNNVWCLFSLSSIIAAKTNIDQYYLKNSLMKMRRKEINYNKKVGGLQSKRAYNELKKVLFKTSKFC